MVALAFILMFNVVLNINETNAASKKTSLKLSSGATYYGEVKNGKPHGKGTMTQVSTQNPNETLEETYTGQWKDGKREGQGKNRVYYVSEEGYISDSIYTGSWKNNKEHGKGISTTESGQYENGIPVINSHYYQTGTFENGENVEFYARHELEDNFNFVEYSNEIKGIYIAIRFEGSGKKIYKKSEFKNFIADYTNITELRFNTDSTNIKTQNKEKYNSISFSGNDEYVEYSKYTSFRDGTESRLTKTAFIDWENDPNYWTFEYNLSKTKQSDIISSKKLSLSSKPLNEEYKTILNSLKPYLEGFKNLGH